jgi:predicted HD superfamily hydrolase involved in NAD metabolism
MISEQRRALDLAVDQLPGGLRDHVLRVVAEARRLARRHGIDEQRAALAALGHDLLRAKPPAELLSMAETAGIELSALERESPLLLHGPLAAHLLAERFGVEDPEVLAAARYHTTGRAGMSDLERLIFVADKIEPSKLRGRPELAETRRLAETSLREAMRHFMEAHVEHARARGWQLHPDTVAALDDLRS